MLNFVTLFNSNYLSRGLVMYESLVKHCPQFHLYIIAFDDITFNYFQKNPLKNLTVISLTQFEDDKLKSVKNTRSAAEYCWTSTPSTVLYCITNFNLECCTYIDADLLFYSNPNVLIEEMGDKSVLITDHRYSPLYDQSNTSGKYCVQFVTFKNTKEGLTVLNWWRDACIEWCYARHENGKFGDQKYLDNWTTTFDGIHELKHLGGGIAPWNVQQYTFEINKNQIIGTEKSTGEQFPAVFFHFHSLKLYANDMVSLTDSGYAISENIIDIFYKPYVLLLANAKQKIKLIDNSINCDGASNNSPYGVLNFSTLKQYYFEGLKSSKLNILGIKLIDKIKHHYYFKISKL